MMEVAVHKVKSAVADSCFAKRICTMVHFRSKRTDQGSWDDNMLQ